MADQTCPKCNGTGVYETGNNDEPCDCPAGDAAVFNVSAPGGLRQVTGRELRAEHHAKARTDTGLGPIPECPHSPKHHSSAACVLARMCLKESEER